MKIWCVIGLMGLIASLRTLDQAWVQAFAQSTSAGPAPRAAAASATAPSDVLLPTGSIWKYWDNGTDLGTPWQTSAYTDTAWLSGPAPLGFGNPVSTVVSFGPDPNNKYITTYFRKVFTVTTPAAYESYLLHLRRDDGAVVYLNGTEVMRSNMPTGAILSTTRAITSATSETHFFPNFITTSFMLTGLNTIAIEVHQAARTSSDLMFDLELIGNKRLPQQPRAAPGNTRFAIIGDFGSQTRSELDVSRAIKAWNPDFVTTVGDNTYCIFFDASLDPYDDCVGLYYHDWMQPYVGKHGAGAANENRFWPSMGNHDWDSKPISYTTFFSLPHNERYYDLVRGPVHFFMLDSDPREPDGVTSTSVQGQWLQQKMAASTATWKLVYMHHPPYTSSGARTNNTWMQWPFKAWGASAVFAGHDHAYERFDIGGMPYFINGAGGMFTYTFKLTPEVGSLVRYNTDFGAMLVEANDCAITYKFMTRTSEVIDAVTQTAPCNTTRFAVIGDFGAAAGSAEYFASEKAVADLVHSLQPDFIVTTGDNNYGTRPPRGTTPDTRGSAEYIDVNIGQFYHGYISPYTGTYGSPAPESNGSGNRFFPTLGNADWYQPFPTSTANLDAHFAFFPWLNGNTYYSFTAPMQPGLVDFFITSVDARDPNRLNDPTKPQQAWLQSGLSQSSAAWQLAFVHYPPYKSDGVTNTQSPSGSVPLRLAYGSWGADAVFSGDSHVYERIHVQPAPGAPTTPYFINGLGGAGLGRFPRDPNGQLLPAIPGSQFRFDADYGAMWVEADPCRITYSLLSLDGTVLDSLTQTRNCLQPTPTPTPTQTPTPDQTQTPTQTPSPTASPQPGFLPRAYVPFVLRH